MYRRSNVYQESRNPRLQLYKLVLPYLVCMNSRFREKYATLFYKHFSKNLMIVAKEERECERKAGLICKQLNLGSISHL